MPSLIVQLDRAAAGTGIRFTRIATGERDAGRRRHAGPTGTAAAGTDAGRGNPAAG